MGRYQKNGKKLGVLGGMGPAAAAEFLRQLAAKCPAATDQEHPVVYMLGDCEIPDRGAAILGEGVSPASQLEQRLRELCAMGADVLAVPCNTAHYFIDDFKDALPKPLVHIVDATILAAQQLEPSGIWMLSTQGTMASGLYQKCAAKYDYRLYQPSDEQAERAQQVIALVKAGALDRAGTLMRALVEELWQQRPIPVMTACTELPLGYAAAGLPTEREVSSIGALAAACVRCLYDEV